MWTPSLHVFQKQGTLSLLAVRTYIMCSSLTACANQVLFFNHPLDVETPETRVDTSYHCALFSPSRLEAGSEEWS